MKTRQEIENRPHDYICFDCGRDFLIEEQKEIDMITTCHLGECCLCGEEKANNSY